MKIDSLKVKNFQSHKESILSFCPTTNVIVGSSDSGKTALMRVIRWVVFNRPMGDSFKRKGAKLVEAIIATSDGCQVIRRRTSSKNQYFLDEEEYEALRSDVPDEVSAVLNLEDINFQFQLDGPFLLLDSPTQIADYLNAILGLEKASQGITVLKREQKDHDKKADFHKEQAQEVEQQLDSGPYDKLPKLEDLVNKAKSKQEEAERVGKQAEALAALSDSLKTAEKALSALPDTKWCADTGNTIEAAREAFLCVSRLSDAIEGLSQVEEEEKRLPSSDSIAEGYKKIQQATESSDRMRGEKREAEELSELIGFVEDTQAQYAILPAKEDMDWMLEAIADVIEAKSSVDKKEKVCYNLDWVIGDLEDTEEKEGEFKKKIKEKERELAEVLNEGGVCPTCGQLVDEEAKEAIFERG